MKTVVLNGKDVRNANAKTQQPKAQPQTGNNLDAQPKPQAEKTEDLVIPPVEDKKEEIAKQIEKFKPEPILTPELRIERVEQFTALSTRYHALKEKSRDLKTFKAGNDKLSSKIIFQNAQGFKFEVQNPTVIGKLTEEADRELDILLNEAQNEVLTFEI